LKSINRKERKEGAKSTKKIRRTYTEEPSESELGEAKAGGHTEVHREEILFITSSPLLLFSLSFLHSVQLCVPIAIGTQDFLCVSFWVLAKTQRRRKKRQYH
jgi:hypothetical protein